MRVVLCCLAKNEELYIRDFVKWYIKLGFDTIYIYNNDDIGNDKLYKALGDDFKDRIEIIDVRGQHKDGLQQEIYTNFYHTHTFDWCFYCDIDEFLFGINDIHAFLDNKIYDNVEQIRIKWKLFGDDGLITRDMSKPVYEVFKIEKRITYTRDLRKVGNLERQGKAIVRGGIKDVVVCSPHFASWKERSSVLISCLPSGKKCDSQIVINEDYRKETVYLHHYMTKSLSEFVNQKLKRTDAVFGTISIDMSYYWRINSQTKSSYFVLYSHLLSFV